MKKIIASAKFTLHGINYIIQLILCGILYVAAAIESVFRFLYRYLQIVLGLVLVFFGIYKEWGLPYGRGLAIALSTSYGLKLIGISFVLGACLGFGVKFIRRSSLRISSKDDDAFTFFSMKLYYAKKHLKTIKEYQLADDIDKMTYGDDKSKQAELRRNEVDEMERFNKQLQERND